MDRNLEIIVRESLDVRCDGTADCHRHYTIRNTIDDGVPLPHLLKAHLHRDSVVQSVHFEDGQQVSYTASCGAYQWDIDIFLDSANIGGLQSKILTIDYLWPNFLPHASASFYEREINVFHSFSLSQYEMEVSCVDPGLLSDPAFNIVPTEYRHAQRSVVHTADTEGYIVRSTNVPPNQHLTIVMSGGGGGVKDLPLLEALGDDFSQEAPFRDVIILFVQHLLSDFEASLKGFKRAGLRAENTFVVGIPYSTKHQVVHRIMAYFGSVSAPESYKDMYHFVRAALLKVYARSVQTGREFLVVEDGGYVARLMREDPEGPEWAKRCRGIVEQTGNGIWVTKQWRDHPDQFRNPLSIPVINVAESSLKQIGEAPLIGRSVVFNIKRLLMPYEHQEIRGWRALLIGCGSIGSEIAKELLKEGCELLVVDSRDEHTISVPSGAEYLPLAELAEVLGQQDIIVGATGRGVNIPEYGDRPPVNSEDHFVRLSDQVVLVNASSKTCEFDWDKLRNIAQAAKTKRGFGYECKIRETGATIRVAAHGFPVNFYHSESAPATKMQPVLAMLFLGCCRLLETSEDSGIIEVSEEDQKYIVERFEKTGGPGVEGLHK